MDARLQAQFTAETLNTEMIKDMPEGVEIPKAVKIIGLDQVSVSALVHVEMEDGRVLRLPMTVRNPGHVSIEWVG